MCDIIMETTIAGHRYLIGKDLIYFLDNNTEKASSFDGTGKSVDWELARFVCARLSVIIAGGLNSDLSVTSKWKSIHEALMFRTVSKKTE